MEGTSMMKKMMLLALAASAIVAVAAPAAAQAQLLYETGPAGEHNALAVGAEVTATSTNLVTEVTATGGKLECEKVTIHGEVTENSAVKSRIENNTVEVEGCNTPVTNPAVVRLTFQGNQAGTGANATFTAAGCTFAGNIPFSYETNTDVVTVTPNPLTEGDQFFSAVCGHAFMTGSFTLETSNGTAVEIT